jgi:hypothetical protein
LNPFTFGLFSWQAGLVFTQRSLELWAEPAKAQARLTQYALEKQRAFARGMLAAGQAAATGATAQAIAMAALKPAHTRVRANARALSRRKRKS